MSLRFGVKDSGFLVMRIDVCCKFRKLRFVSSSAPSSRLSPIKASSLVNSLTASLALLLVTSLPFSSEALAEEGTRFITLAYENDIFVGEDKGFTNGISIAYGRVGFATFDRSNTPFVIRALTGRLPISTNKNNTRSISHQFFQRLQTPTFIAIPVFLPDDLPYAGLLAYQGTLFSSNSRTADQLSLTLGIVGPSALGEQVQTETHALVGEVEPEGWDFQIRNTPVFKLDYQRVWSLHRTQSLRRSSTQFEVLGLGGLAIGNMETSTEWGFAFRVGKNLGRNLQAFNLKADRQVNPLTFSAVADWYAFAGARLGYVATDIFVNGDLPDGLETNITLDPIRTEVGIGIAYGIGRYAFVAQFAGNSTIFEQRGGFDRFGALSLTYRF